MERTLSTTSTKNNRVWEWSYETEQVQCKKDRIWCCWYLLEWDKIQYKLSKLDHSREVWCLGKPAWPNIKLALSSNEKCLLINTQVHMFIYYAVVHKRFCASTIIHDYTKWRNLWNRCEELTNLCKKSPHQKNWLAKLGMHETKWWSMCYVLAIITFFCFENPYIYQTNYLQW